MHYTLIGMSGAGKSHVGKQLATALGYEFFDIDTAMEELYQKPLQTILLELGDERFLIEQAALIKETDFHIPHVIATGGSAVYTEDAMQYLKDISRVVFIDVPLEMVAARIDISNRGIVGLGDKTFTQLYAERQPLYKQWADVTVDGDTPLQAILSHLKGNLLY